MKITTLLKINGQATTLMSQQLSFQVGTPASGVLKIKSAIKPEVGQLVEIAMRLGAGETSNVFLGFIETVTPTHQEGYELFVRELAALLNRRIAINLQHCQARDVLAVISEQTGAHFVLPDSEWTKIDVPRFQHIGGGYGALDYLLRAFQVPNPIWQQQTNGIIYVGELDKSLMGGKVINIDAEKFSNMAIVGGDLPVIPNLRPGISINVNGEPKRIATVRIIDDMMRLGWVQSLHDFKLRGIQ